MIMNLTGQNGLSCFFVLLLSPASWGERLIALPANQSDIVKLAKHAPSRIFPKARRKLDEAIAKKCCGTACMLQLCLVTFLCFSFSWSARVPSCQSSSPLKMCCVCVNSNDYLLLNFYLTVKISLRLQMSFSE